MSALSWRKSVAQKRSPKSSCFCHKLPLANEAVFQAASPQKDMSDEKESDSLMAGHK